MSATSRTRPVPQEPAAAPPSVPARVGADRWVARAVLGVGVTVSVLLHLHAEYRFPVPWIDEAHFLSPAVNLARDLTLGAPQLNAPEGVFWMPDGYAVALATAFALLPDTIAVARLISLALTLAFAGCLYAATARLGGSRLLAATALAVWLVSPRVVMMANLARMEPLVLALVGAALLLAARRRWLAALAVASLGPLAHPAGVLVLGAFAGAALLHHRHLRDVGLRPSAPERVLLAGVALAWLSEVVHFLRHLQLAVDHVELQLERKSRRPIAPSVAEWAAMILGGVGALVGVRVGPRIGRDRAAVLTAASLLVAGFTVLTTVGNMMWYRVVGVETALVLVGFATAVVLPALRSSAGGRRRWLAAPGALALVAAGTAATLTLPVYGMRISDGSRGEWDQLLATAVVALRGFDEELTGPALVAVVRSSAVGFPLANERWRHLRFVTTTPMTPLQPGEADYVLSPEPLSERRRGSDRGRPAAPVLQMASRQGTFELYLYRAAEPGLGTRVG